MELKTKKVSVVSEFSPTSPITICNKLWVQFLLTHPTYSSQVSTTCFKSNLHYDVLLLFWKKNQIYKFDKYKPNYMHFGVEECNTLPGYSGRRPGYSGHGVSKSSKFFHLGPTTIKTNSSLSQLTLTLTLSRYSLSLSLPQEPSLSPNPRTQKSPSQINPKTKEAPISVGDHLL